jgi:hypothetical protein
MHISCWTHKATNTHLNILSVCIKYFRNYCFSTATMVTRTRPNVTLYVHCLSCFLLCAVLFPGVLNSADKTVGNRYKLTRSGDPAGGLRPSYVAYVFVFLGSIIISKVNKSTVSDHAPSRSASQRQGRALSFFYT